MRASLPQRAFSSGEISPLLYGRADYQRYQTGLRAANGWLPLRQGGFTRAPGTIYRGTTLNNQAGRLIGFEFASDDALELEFTPLKMRVWRYGALVEATPGVPYELTTPYDAAAIDRLQWVQSADVIYLVDGVLPMQRLARMALNNWSIGDHQINDGPFLVGNFDTAHTIQASGETGSVTLTASQSTFSADMVGSLIRLEPFEYPGIARWVGNATVSPGGRRRYDGKIYQVVAGTDTGVNPPVHIEGDENTGGITWRFVSDGVGIARITGFTSDTEVSADVVKAIPEPCVTAPTYRWSEGAWSTKNGYPSAIEIFDQRLVAAATPTEPRTIWFSTIGDFASFAPGVEADEGFAYSVSGSESLNRVLWLKAGRRGLHIGALGEVFSSRSNTSGQAIGPTTFELVTDASIGSLAHRPIAPDGKPVFISKDKARVFEMRYAFADDANLPIEMSLPAEHLGAAGFEEIIWQSGVQRMAWLRRGDGTLAVMLADVQEEVLGWAPLSLAGGFVESICATPDPTTGQDVLKMIVRRTIDGQTVRHIEEQPAPFGVLTGAQPIHQAVHLFAVSVFEAAPAATMFTVPHLVGEVVYVWSDVGEFGPYTVPAGGDVTLPAAATYAVIGKFDDTHRPETLPIIPPARDGDTTGRQRRLLPGGGIRVHRTAALFAQSVERNLGKPDVVNRAQSIIDRAVGSELALDWSGEGELQVQSGFADEVSVRFAPVGGAPATVLALTAMVKESGS